MWSFYLVAGVAFWLLHCVLQLNGVELCLFFNLFEVFV